MRHSDHLLRLILLIVTPLLLLNGCGGGSGGSYGMPKWDFKTQQQQTQAEAPPSDLSDADITSSAAPKSTTPALDDTYQSQQSPAPLAPMPQKLKVGILLPLTGQHTALGQSMLKSAQMALFDIAQKDFDLRPYDTQGTFEGARQAANKAVQENVSLILGPVFADSVRAVRSITRPRNISVIAFTTDWGVTGDNIHTLGFLPFDQIERIIDYALANNLKRIGVVAPQTPYGKAVISAAEAMGSFMGAELVESYSYPPKTANLSPGLRDFTKYDARNAQAEAYIRAKRIEKGKNVNEEISEAEIQRVKAELGPPYDAVLIAAGRENAIAISNLLSHYDLTPRRVKRLGTGLFDDPSLAGEITLNGAAFAAPSPQSREKFEVRYQEIYGTPAPRLASLAYDATALAAVLAHRGIQLYGQPDFSTTAITNPNGFAGIDGIFRFLSNGTVERGLAILEFNSGKIVEIDPAPTTFIKK
jgi:ABC-type branched-subunit amino acid transport system substrate-binding protein